MTGWPCPASLASPWTAVHWLSTSLSCRPDRRRRVRVAIGFDQFCTTALLCSASHRIARPQMKCMRWSGTVVRLKVNVSLLVRYCTNEGEVSVSWSGTVVGLVVNYVGQVLLLV